MALKMNTFAKNAFLDSILWNGSNGSDIRYSRVGLRLYSGTMPATPPTTSIYTTNQLWISSSVDWSSINALQMSRSGDVMSVSAGTMTNNATTTGTVTWALVYWLQNLSGNSSALFMTDSVGLQGSNSVVQLSTLSAVSGSPITLVSLSYRMSGV